MVANTKQPAISIIIPTLNEAASLGRCLRSLVATGYPAEEYEVIIVDNGSEDETVEIARSFESRLCLRVLWKKGVAVGALRNVGARVARGQSLAFLDSDCVVPREWLRVGRRESENNPRAVIGAVYMPPTNSSWVAVVWHHHEYRAADRGPRFVPAGDLWISRDHFLRHGGFSEELESSEDSELCRRLVDDGFRIVHLPELSVVHLGTPQTVSGFVRQQLWHGVGVLQDFRRNIGRMPNAKVIAFSMFIGLCWLGAAAGLPALLLLDCRACMAIPVLGLVLAPLMLSLRETLPTRSWSETVPLALLLLVYGTARVACLFRAFGRSRKSSPGS